MKYTVGTMIMYDTPVETLIGTIVQIKQPNVLYPSGFYLVNWDKRKPGSHARQFIENQCTLIHSPNEIMKDIL